MNNEYQEQENLSGAFDEEEYEARCKIADDLRKTEKEEPKEIA